MQNFLGWFVMGNSGQQEQDIGHSFFKKCLEEYFSCLFLLVRLQSEGSTKSFRGQCMATMSFNFTLPSSLQDGCINPYSEPTVKLTDAALVVFVTEFLLQPRVTLCLQNQSRLQSVHVEVREAGDPLASFSPRSSCHLRLLQERPGASPSYIHSIAAVSPPPLQGSLQASPGKPCYAAADCF